jgi:hypothetical protein
MSSHRDGKKKLFVDEKSVAAQGTSILVRGSAARLTVASVKVRTSPVTRGSPYVIFRCLQGGRYAVSGPSPGGRTLFSDRQLCGPGHVCGAVPSDIA